MDCPTVVVESQKQTCAAAAAAAAAHMRLTIRSAPWVADAYGVQVFAAMIEAARRACPSAEIAGLLDCGTSAGHALAALRHGLDIRVDAPADVRAKLSDIAAQMGRCVCENEGPVLNLAGAHDPETACRAWLSTLTS